MKAGDLAARRLLEGEEAASGSAAAAAWASGGGGGYLEQMTKNKPAKDISVCGLEQLGVLKPRFAGFRPGTQREVHKGSLQDLFCRVARPSFISQFGPTPRPNFILSNIGALYY